MRRALGLAAALVVGLAGTVLAGAMYWNDSGAVAWAVRIEFSEPAEITSMYPNLPQRDPQGPATAIVLSGGEVPAGSWFSFTWRPDTARVVKIEWLASPPTSARPNLGFSDPKAKPEVHGGLLNPAFFAHPAYVMQGVSERDKAFALPLAGVPELSFFPFVSDLSTASLPWTYEVSHPEGIGAAIEDGTLYIWGSNPEWQGYGEVHLHVSAPDGCTSRVTIPVVVFCSDRTLVNPDGKKDYFVPWGVILDINRILSTEEHMRRYDKPDLGLLDRTLRFSRWRPMEYQKNAGVATGWINEFTYDGTWRQPAMFRMVDVVLEELRYLGFNSLTVHNAFYIDLEDGSIQPRYGAWGSTPNFWGQSKRPHELAYIVDEAHRLGLRITLANFYVPFVPLTRPSDSALELVNYCPPDLNAFLVEYTRHTKDELSVWTSLGVDMAGVGTQLEGLCDNTLAASRVIPLLREAVVSSREVFPGPVTTLMGLIFELNLRPYSSITLPFWEEPDVLAVGINYPDLAPLTPYSIPTLEQLVAGWEQLISRYIQPFQSRFNKPFIAYEVGTYPVLGCSNFGAWCRIAGRVELSPSTFSMEDMERYFLSQHRAFERMAGYYGSIYSFFLLTFDYRDVGGYRDYANMSPRGIVDDLIQQLFLGEARPRVVQIDGKADDWDNISTVRFVDPRGDSKGANDIIGMRYTSDELFLYFTIDYLSAPSGFLVIQFDTSGNGKEDFFLMLNDVHAAWWRHETIYHPDHPRVPIIGIADAVDGPTFIETRIPRPFLVDYWTGGPFSVRLVHADRNWNVHDETVWYRIDRP